MYLIQILQGKVKAICIFVKQLSPHIIKQFSETVIYRNAFVTRSLQQNHLEAFKNTLLLGTSHMHESEDAATL
jgi:hypothetical protein